MAKKNPRNLNRHVAPRESFHLPEDLREALEAFIDHSDPKPGKSAVLRSALQDYLSRHGFWPKHRSDA